MVRTGLHFGPSEPPVGIRKQEHLASSDVFAEHRQWVVLLLLAVRARLPSRLEFQGSAESIEIEPASLAASPLSSPSPGGGGRTQRRRTRNGTICKSPCLHRVVLSLPRQLETTPVGEVVSALCGSRIFADVPPSHHDLGCLVLITQVVRNGSFAKVL